MVNDIDYAGIVGMTGASLFFGLLTYFSATCGDVVLTVLGGALTVMMSLMSITLAKN